MPPDDFWSPGPPRRRRRANEPDPDTAPTSPAGPQSFPNGPQSFPSGPRYGVPPGPPPGPQGPPPGQHPQQGPPPGYPDQPWRDPSPGPGGPGPQSFASGPVYPGAPPTYRSPGAPAAGPNGHHQQPPFEAPGQRGPERSGPAPFGQPGFAPPAYGPSQQYGQPPSSPPLPYGQAPGYPPAAPPPAAGYGGPGYGDPQFGEAGYAPGPYDNAATQVFEPGVFASEPYGGDQFANGHTAATGQLPVFDNDFGRSAGARIDFGPREAFGPPPSAEPERAPDDVHLFTRLRRIRSHAQRRRSKRWLAVMLVILVIGAAAAVRFAPMSPWYRGGSDNGAVGTTMPFHDAQFTAEDLGTEGFLSWAYEDVTTGAVVGSANFDQATDATSMLSAWIAADFLRKAAEGGQSPSDADKADIEAMIRDDDVAAADRIVAKLGDSQEWIGQLRSMCDLTDVKPAGASWRSTEITARDAARLGGCLADNRAAGAQWTPWLLSEMRQVRGAGDFGIRNAFPSGQRPSIAIKNGVAFVDADGQWRANCLAVTPSWSLAVLQRYPKHGDANADLAHLDVICQQVVFRLTGANP